MTDETDPVDPEHGDDGHMGIHCGECAEKSGVVNEEWTNPQGYPEPEVVDWRLKSDHHNHGEKGHIGYRCGQCAQLSKETVYITRDSVDYWQNLQIDWQEACDIIMSEFQQDVQDHFPDHLPANCQDCPVQGSLPEKPLPPVERSLKQIQSAEAAAQK